MNVYRTVWGVIFVVLGLSLSGYGGYKTYHAAVDWKDAQTQISQLNNLTPQDVEKAKEAAKNSGNIFGGFLADLLSSPEMIEAAKERAQAQRSAANGQLSIYVPLFAVGLYLIKVGNKNLRSASEASDVLISAPSPASSTDSAGLHPGHSNWLSASANFGNHDSPNASACVRAGLALTVRTIYLGLLLFLGVALPTVITALLAAKFVSHGAFVGSIFFGFLAYLLLYFNAFRAWVYKKGFSHAGKSMTFAVVRRGMLQRMPLSWSATAEMFWGVAWRGMLISMPFTFAMRALGVHPLARGFASLLLGVPIGVLSWAWFARRSYGRTKLVFVE